MNKKQSRLGRARQTRLRIRSLRGIRLSVRRSNKHIYAVIFDAQQSVLTSASTLEADLRTTLSGKSSCDLDAATIVGERIAKKALALGIDRLSFDRSGYKYHGRVRALAEAARLAGLQF